MTLKLVVNLRYQDGIIRILHKLVDIYTGLIILLIVLFIKKNDQVVKKRKGNALS